MKAYELLALCPGCWTHPKSFGVDRCDLCLLLSAPESLWDDSNYAACMRVVEAWRRVAEVDQEQAAEHHLAAVSNWRNGDWKRA